MMSGHFRSTRGSRKAKCLKGCCKAEGAKSASGSDAWAKAHRRSLGAGRWRAALEAGAIQENLDEEVVSALAAACCQRSVTGSAAAAESVKIGYMATFSGPPGVLGEHNRDGFLLGIEHLGGKLGGLEVELLEADDQLQPDIGKQIIDRYLQSDRVDFVVGIIFSNVMMAVYEDVVGSETFLISTNAGPSPIAGESCSE